MAKHTFREFLENSPRLKSLSNCGLIIRYEYSRALKDLNMFGQMIGGNSGTSGNGL